MRSKKILAGNLFGTIFKYVVIAIVLIVSLYPILWVLISSFKSTPGGLSLPQEWVFDGYKTIFTKLSIGTYFINSILVTGLSSLFSVAIVTMAGYVCARLPFRGRNLVTFMFASTLFIPQYAISFPIYRLVNTLNLYDKKAGLIFVYTGLNIAISFFIIRGYFIPIPKEMEEAAQVDGCGHLHTFFRIMLPLAKPGIVTALVLTVLNNWNEFFYASLLLQSRENMTIPALLGQFSTAYSMDLNGMFSAIVVAIVPTIIFFICFSDIFINSLTDGAVKG